MSPRERDIQARKEGDPNYSKFPKSPSSSRRWSSYKNPRIVPVSRTFGGKDRHSKVCTVRGLRDRRIRLSVHTAVQLYDLQDRLGLGQPSKVVDWLLDVTQDDIDRLPPLPSLPGTQLIHQPVAASYQSAANPQSPISHFLTSNHPCAKYLGISPTKEGNKTNETAMEKDKWIASHNEQENQEGFGGFVAQLSAQNLFPLSNQSAVPNLPYNPYFHWEPPNFTLSQFGGGYPFPNQIGHQFHNNPSTSVLPSSSQLFFCPSAATIPSFIPTFPSSYITPSMDNDLRQINQLQHLPQNHPLLPTTLHSISSPMKSFAQNVNSKTGHSQENGTRRSEEDNKKS